jgi:hypothetical protein
MRCHAVAESSSAATAKRTASVARPSRAGVVQTKLAVGAPGDAYEHEADRAADAVLRASPADRVRPVALDVTPLAQRAPAEPKKDEDEKRVQRKAGTSSPLSIALDFGPPVVQRFRAEPHRKDEDDDQKRLQKKSAGASTDGLLEAMGVPAPVESQIAAMSAGGDFLPRAERAFFEDRFGYDFRDVRVHAGADAALAAAALNARAFTVGQHIFFGGGEYRPGSTEGRRLVAHELTHTIQQSPHAAGVGRLASATPPVTARVAPLIQREGDDDDGGGVILGQIRRWALDVPGYKLLGGLLGHDPITDQPVTMSGEELIHEGLVEFVPDGEAIYQKLQADKSITQFLDYFNQQFALLDLTWEKIKAIFKEAWDAVSLAEAVVDPSGAWEKVKAVFRPHLERLKTFIINVGGYILNAIKNKVLEWLRSWGTKIPGYSLLTFILGKDPFTDEPVPRTPTTFVKAVLDLVPGGDKIFENLEKSHTIEKTVAWLNDEITKLDLSWEKIKGLFLKAWDVISIADLLDPLGFVDKIREIFEAPAIRVVNFAIAVGKKVLEFIFEGVMILAGPMGHRITALFEKASATFSKIVADPVAFLGHLVDAVVLGFKQFVAKIGEYMLAGVIAWLTSALEGAGITLPKVWDLKGVLSLVLQILGITYAKIRAKIVKIIGEETMSKLERVWDFLVALATEGPAAAWHKIAEALGNLWDLVIGGIKDWAIVKIIKTAVAQLVVLFNPVGAVFEAIVETYRTVEFFVKKINQILSLVEAIVDSIANIAAGQIAAAANYVEKTLARTIPVIIGFLASLIGLDDISEGIRDTIEALQEKVDEAIDAAIDWIVKQVKALFGKDEKEGDQKGAAGPGDLKDSFEMHGTPHTIRAHSEAGKVEFRMSSPEEKDISETIRWIRDFYTDLYSQRKDPDKAAALSSRLDALEAKLDQAVKDVLAAPDATSAQETMKSQEIELRTGLSDIGQEFGIRGLYYTPPTHRYIASGLRSYGRASGAAGNPISAVSRGLPPSPASGNVPGTSLLGYERGHLLASSLGGPGDEVENLAPMSGTTNRGASGMFGPEDAARTAIDSEGDPVMLRYTVTCKYKAEGGLQSWLESSFNAPPNATARLFELASTNEYTDADAYDALGGPAVLPQSKFDQNRESIRGHTAYYFLPEEFQVSIETIQGPPVKSPWSIPNHQGVSLP